MNFDRQKKDLCLENGKIELFLKPQFTIYERFLCVDRKCQIRNVYFCKGKLYENSINLNFRAFLTLKSGIFLRFSVRLKLLDIKLMLPKNQFSFDFNSHKIHISEILECNFNFLKLTKRVSIFTLKYLSKN